ncbi:MarC family protein, partial [Oleiphilus sp. HI0128]
VGALVALFVIIDPIGMALIFHSLLESGSGRKLIAFKACLISTMLLVLFGNFGELLLSKLAISIHAFKISGGVLLFYTAFRMVTSSLSFAGSGNGRDISVFPLSIPLLAGPGSLTVSILLFSSTSSALGQLSVMFAIVSISTLTCILMIFSGNVKRLVGAIGDEVLKRFLGMILAALAIQFILDGLRVFT